MPFSTEPGIRSRMLRMAEAIELMHFSGAKTAAWEKPPLREFCRNSARHAPPADTPTFALPYFYGSRELKRSDTEGIYKTSFTRVIGAYITPAGWYGVYSLGSGLCGWDTKGETKACVLLRMASVRNGWPWPESRIGTGMDARSGIIARKPEAAVQILKNTDTEKDFVCRREDGRIAWNRALWLDDVYKKIYFVPANSDDIRLLRMLAVPDMHSSLCAALLPEEARRALENRYLAADGRGEAGEIYGLFCDLELKRIHNFCGNMRVNRIPLQNCTAVCFPWQEPILRAYLGPEVNIRTVSQETANGFWAFAPAAFSEKTEPFEVFRRLEGGEQAEHSFPNLLFNCYNGRMSMRGPQGSFAYYKKAHGLAFHIFAARPSYCGNEVIVLESAQKELFAVLLRRLFERGLISRDTYRFAADSVSAADAPQPAPNPPGGTALPERKARRRTAD